MVFRGLRALVSGLFLGSAMAAAVPLQAQAQSGESAEQLAARFGALEDITQISLSPDGTKIAFISPRKGGRVLEVANLAEGGFPTAITSVPSEEGELRFCKWSTNARLVCQVHYIVDYAGQLVSFTRIFGLDDDGKNATLLSNTQSLRARTFFQNGGSVIDWDVEGEPGRVLMTKVFVPENTIGTRLANEEEGLGVEMVDTIKGRRHRVEKPDEFATGYITDGHGTIRVKSRQQTGATGLLKPSEDFFYRTPGDWEWQWLSSWGGPQEAGVLSFEPLAVDGKSNRAFGWAWENGHRGLYAVALDGSLTREKLFAADDVDIDGLIRIGRDNRVVGLSYARERREQVYFDPEMGALSKALAGALPGEVAVRVVDADREEKNLLLRVTGDTEPGMLYLFNKAERRLEEVLPVRPKLVDLALAPMKPVMFPAGDGVQIPGYLTLPPGSTGRDLPAIVMPHGGPSARDEWGFDWMVQFFAARGFAVLQPNYRGSAGYGSEWYKENGFKSWKTAIGDVNDAGRWLVAQGIAAPDKLAIFGWSYGGYAALQSGVLDPDLFKAVVAVAPVTDFEILRSEAEGFTNAALVREEIGSGPHLREGSPAQNADKIKAPVLLFHGTLDQNVGVRESQVMAKKLQQAGKSVRYVEFDGLDHFLYSSEARTQLLADSDAFLHTQLKLD